MVDEAGMAAEPGDPFRFVGGIVLEDDVDELAGQHLCLEGIAVGVTDKHTPTLT